MNFASLLVNRHSPFGPTPRREPTETDDGTSQLQLDADWVILSVCNMATPRCWLGPTRVKRTSFRPAYWGPFRSSAHAETSDQCLLSPDRPERSDRRCLRLLWVKNCLRRAMREGPLWVSSGHWTCRYQCQLWVRADIDHVARNVHFGPEAESGACDARRLRQRAKT